MSSSNLMWLRSSTDVRSSATVQPSRISTGSWDPETDPLPLELGQRREDAERRAAAGPGRFYLRPLTGEHPQADAAVR